MNTQSTSMKLVLFSEVPIGTEFMWGSFYEVSANNHHYCANWGKKRSSRTADYRHRILGKLSDHTTWGYWKQNDRVFIADNHSSN